MSNRGYALCDNKTVETIGKMDFTGNVIPHLWYTHIRKAGKKGSKAYLLAINILADIIYWYRPIEVRDEQTGRVLGWRKKFKADKLQKNYSAWAEQFGQTTRQVRDAVCFLKQQGYITVEVRTVRTSHGHVLDNITFIEPIVAKIQAITYSQDAAPDDEISSLGPDDEISLDPHRNFDRGVPKKRDRSSEKTSHSIDYAETAAQNTSSSPPSTQSDASDNDDDISSELVALLNSLDIRGKRDCTNIARTVKEHGYSLAELEALKAFALERHDESSSGLFITMVRKGQRAPSPSRRKSNDTGHRTLTVE